MTRDEFRELVSRLGGVVEIYEVTRVQTILPGRPNRPTESAIYAAEAELLKTEAGTVFDFVLTFDQDK